MSEKKALGIVIHETSNRRTDYLYRVSIKGFIRNERGEVLVVKETGRRYWDLPGGGMDHSENIKSAIAREMNEEVNLIGDFTYEILSVDDPAYLPSPLDFWQLRLIFVLRPENLSFSPGDDGDEVAFMDPEVFKDSEVEVERRIYRYAAL